MTRDALRRRATSSALRVPTSCRRTGRCRECVVEVDGRRRAPRARRPRPSASCGRRSGSPARRSSTTPDAEVAFAVVRRRLRIVVARADAERRPDRPAWSRVRRRHRPLGRRADRAARTAASTASRSTSARRPSCSSSSTSLTGRTLEVVALENPQRFGGSDVMNRISYDRPQRRRAAPRGAAGRSTASCASSTSGTGIDRREVLRGRRRRQLDDARPLLRARRLADRRAAVQVDRPSSSCSRGTRDSTALVALAHELGLWAHPQARVWGAPLIASHVGADVAADLVATGLDARSDGRRDARRRRHEHRGRDRRPRAHRRRELPGRPGVRGRRR